MYILYTVYFQIGYSLQRNTLLRIFWLLFFFQDDIRQDCNKYLIEIPALFNILFCISPRRISDEYKPLTFGPLKDIGVSD